MDSRCPTPPAILPLKRIEYYAHERRKAAFLVLRANGWSLDKISRKLKVPKSTLFRWESDQRAQIHMIKCVQIEKLQEKYLSSFEEELQHLSSYLARVENALAKHEFDSMRPEYLLQAALHLRTRLNKFRSDVPLHAPIQQIGFEPVPVAGCISRAESNVWLHEEEPEPAATGTAGIPAGTRATCANSQTEESPNRSNGHPVNGHSLNIGEPALTIDVSSNGSTDEKEAHQNGTFRHENGEGSKLDDSAPATCNRENGTSVPLSLRSSHA